MRGITSAVLTSDGCFELLPDENTCQVWREAQDLLVAQLGAEHITRTDSSHPIQLQNPEIVIDSVRRVVEAARKKSCALGLKNHGQCVKASNHARGDR